MIRVEITENDIKNALNTLRYSPIELATARSLNVELERLEVKLDEVIVWMYDDSDYASYKYADEESYIDVYDFIQEWELFIEDETIEDFSVKPFTFDLEEKNDPRTESRHWAATSIDYSEFADRPSSDKKNLKFRLTDDDE